MPDSDTDPASAPESARAKNEGTAKLSTPVTESGTQAVPINLEHGLTGNINICIMLPDVIP